MHVYACERGRSNLHERERTGAAAIKGVIDVVTTLAKEHTALGAVCTSVLGAGDDNAETCQALAGEQLH